jgi:hypothetical protein
VDMTIFHFHEVLLMSQFGDRNIWNVLVKCACDAVNWMYILHSSYSGNLTFFFVWGGLESLGIFVSSP